MKVCACLLACLTIALLPAASPQESAMVRLLRGGRIPPERQGTVLEMIGKRGSAADLTYVFERALEADGFAPAVRVKALDVLAEATRNRRLRPESGLERVGSLLGEGGTDSGLRRAAARLAGLWRVEALADALAALAEARGGDPLTRAAAVEALAEIGGDPGRERLENLAEGSRSRELRMRAVGGLARIDAQAAGELARDLLAESSDGDDITPLVSAFLDRRGGSDILAGALAREPVEVDAAKRGLRAMYALGRADAGLVAELSKQAKLDAEVAPLSDEELARLVAEVQAKGDPARGEQVFRRADLNCMGCHAIAGAGSSIGPDLSALGASSPPDYVIRSIMQPDESIKEQYQTLVVLTNEGQVYQGIVADKDDQRVVLREAAGTTREIPTAEIEDQRTGGSLMPRGLVNLVTQGEFVDLVRFLSELGKPGPFAIPPAGLIRRWRVPREPSEALRAGVPDPVTLGSHLVEADPARLRTVYAALSGDLDLDEIGPLATEPVVYVLAEFDVTAAGTVIIEPDAPEGLSFWVDAQPLERADGRYAMFLPNGRHTLVVRVDRAARSSKTLRVELRKNQGSSTAFTILGGA
jgi:putative heme-binding domain-containing protein